MELRWQIPQTAEAVMPFIRLQWDWALVEFDDMPTGTLFNNAFDVHIGVHLFRILDVHAILGGTYATKTAAGFGVALGYMF